MATSEDQEDELLCSAFADDSRRICVGTQGGFITLWKTGEWMDHVDRIAPTRMLRRGDDAASIDCMVQLDDQVIVGASDGSIIRVGFRPNAHSIIEVCDDGVTCLAAVPEQEGWIVSASGSKVTFWNIDGTQNGAVDEDDDSSEEEKPKKKRKKTKKGSKKSSVGSSTFFADLG